MIENFLKKINLIQEFELNFEKDKAIFLDGLKFELDLNSIKQDIILDAFMSNEDKLKVVFNKNSFVLELIPDLWIRSDFTHHFKLVCKIEELEKGFIIKTKLFNDNYLLVLIFFIVFYFLLVLIIALIIQGEFLILLSVPVFFFVFGAVYLYQLTYLKRLKNSALKLFNKVCKYKN